MTFVSNPQLLPLQVLSEGGITLAYFSISIAFLLFIRKHRDFRFNGALATFGFFSAAGGLSHAVGIWAIWHPSLWLDGALEAGAAAVSLAAAIMLVPLLPSALAPSAGNDLEDPSAQVEQGGDARRRVEQELRASAEQLRQIEEHAPIGLAIVALDGRFVRVNPALCALLGYSADELLAMTFQTLTHPDDLEADLAQLQRTHDGEIKSYKMDKRYFHKEGHVVWILLNVSLVRDEKGEPNYYIAQIQDISARKAAEQAARAAQEAALAAAETKSRFLAVMSHEIRTPMNGIIGMTELLASSQLNQEQCEYVKVVRDSGESLLRVLNDILDYSKIEAGKLDLENVDFDLTRQIGSVASLLAPQFKAKGVSLTTHLGVDVPFALLGDPGRLRQILINLIGNALKFTPAGGSVRVLVTAEPRRGSAIPVKFEVIDIGIGIAPEVQRRLFLPFSQGDSSITRRYGGTGLGLSICNQLVALMGGAIDVVSTVGYGSSFWFTIPFREGHWIERALDAPAREMGERRSTMKPRPEKLLLAEDNEVNMLLALKQFKRLGFGVTIVSNGREALEAVQNERFDVVFMDCHMPEMDGFEATGAIRKLDSRTRARVPIVAMTANAQPEDREACLRADMDDYISKPVTLSDLHAVLARWLPDLAEDVPLKRAR